MCYCLPYPQTANFAALTALLQPQDRLMGLGLPDGGHLTHGYYTAKKKITASAIYFQSLPYSLVPETQLIDYEAVNKTAKVFKPRLIICGASAYPRDWDYKNLRATADEQQAWLLCDIAHTSGLIAGGQLASPFEYCHVVTTTTCVLLLVLFIWDIDYQMIATRPSVDPAPVSSSSARMLKAPRTSRSVSTTLFSPPAKAVPTITPSRASPLPFSRLLSPPGRHTPSKL